jgi:hypothetical protein
MESTVVVARAQGHNATSSNAMMSSKAKLSAQARTFVKKHTALRKISFFSIVHFEVTRLIEKSFILINAMSQPAENTKVVATPYNLERFMASI